MAQAVVNGEPGLTGVASSKDRWVEASHWKSIISLSSSESLACEREGMRTVIHLTWAAGRVTSSKGGILRPGLSSSAIIVMSVSWLWVIELLYHGPSGRFTNHHPE